MIQATDSLNSLQKNGILSAVKQQKTNTIRKTLSNLRHKLLNQAFVIILMRLL